MELAAFRRTLEDCWRQLDEALEGLDERAMAEPGVVEQWSVKDLLGHVAAWEQVALRQLGQFRAGEPVGGVSGAGVDGYNAAESERRAERSLTEVRAELAETRRRLREELGALSEEEWGTVVGAERPSPLSDHVGGALGGMGPRTHAAEHAHHILRWRAERERRAAEHALALVAGRRELLASIAGLSEEELTRPRDEQGWSIRDSLAHIAAWDRRVAERVAGWLDGTPQPPPLTSVDDFNQRAVARAREKPGAATLVDLADSHALLLDGVLRARGSTQVFQYPDGVTGDLERICRESAEHEHEHAAEIRAWRGS